MRIDVSIDRSMLTFGDRLSKLASKIPKAAAEGLNEGGDLLRTPVRRDLREQTGVKAYRSITSRTTSKRAYPGNLVYKIEGTGKGMPIKEFPVRASVRGPVTATPWGVTHTFARSFMTRGQRLLRARLGAARLPVRALYGPAVSKEIVKGETASHFQANAAPTVERTVMKRLVRLMG